MDELPDTHRGSSSTVHASDEVKTSATECLTRALWEWA